MTPSTNIQAPFFGPRLPEYPILRQIVRIGSSSSSTSGSGSVYSGWIEQSLGNLPALRDREACIVLEPNGLSLSPGSYHKARLIGNYDGLPLLAVSVLCCTAIAFGISSGSSGSSAFSSGSSSFSSSGSSSPSSSLSSPSSSSSLFCRYGCYTFTILLCGPCVPFNGTWTIFQEGQDYFYYSNGTVTWTMQIVPGFQFGLMEPVWLLVGQTGALESAVTVGYYIPVSQFDCNAVNFMLELIPIDCPCSSSSGSSLESSSLGSLSSNPCYMGCYACPLGTAHQWAFTVANQTDPAFNGNFVATIEDDCHYSVMSGDVQWDLVLTELDGRLQWVLGGVHFASSVQFSIPAEQWNCNCPNTLLGEPPAPILSGPFAVASGETTGPGPIFLAPHFYSAGDLLVAIYVGEPGSEAYPQPTPAGWTQLVLQTSAGESFSVLYWYKTALGAPHDNFSIDAPGTSQINVYAFSNSSGLPGAIASTGIAPVLTMTTISPGTVAYSPNSMTWSIFFVHQYQFTLAVAPQIPGGEFQIVFPVLNDWAGAQGNLVGGYNFHAGSGSEMDSALLNGASDADWVAVTMLVSVGAPAPVNPQSIVVVPLDCIGVCPAMSSSSPSSAVSSSSPPSLSSSPSLPSIPSGPCWYGCYACPAGMPTQWGFTISGQGPDFNGSWVVTIASGCVYTTTVGDTSWTLALQILNGRYQWVLTGQAGDQEVQYAIDSAEFNCVCPNVLLGEPPVCEIGGPTLLDEGRSVGHFAIHLTANVPIGTLLILIAYQTTGDASFNTPSSWTPLVSLPSIQGNFLVNYYWKTAQGAPLDNVTFPATQMNGVNVAEIYSVNDGASPPTAATNSGVGVVGVPTNLSVGPLAYAADSVTWSIFWEWNGDGAQNIAFGPGEFYRILPPYGVWTEPGVQGANAGGYNFHAFPGMQTDSATIEPLFADAGEWLAVMIQVQSDCGDSPPVPSQVTITPLDCMGACGSSGGSSPSAEGPIGFLCCGSCDVDTLAFQFQFNPGTWGGSLPPACSDYASGVNIVLTFRGIDPITGDCYWDDGVTDPFGTPGYKRWTLFFGENCAWELFASDGSVASYQGDPALPDCGLPFTVGLVGQAPACTGLPDTINVFPV
jgi:hypothetical protein